MSAIPVEIIIGFLLLATYLIKGISVISNEAILYIGVFNFSNKSAALLSKGEEKQIMPISFAKLYIGLCQSQGNEAFLYKSCRYNPSPVSILINFKIFLF